MIRRKRLLVTAGAASIAAMTGAITVAGYTDSVSGRFGSLRPVVVTTAANAAMEFDLSQVDMTKVAALFVVFSAGGSGEIKLSANDTVVSSICSNNFYNRCNFHCCPYP